MTGEKVLEVINLYRNTLTGLGIPEANAPHDLKNPSLEQVKAHCHGMLDEMEVFVSQGRMEKVFRWLGFVQGGLFAAGIFSIEELKNHNRPDRP
jgi:hypothetical protein